MSNVPVYTHIQDPTRFYTLVFDAPFIAHKVTVKCVFMKTYVLESFDNCTGSPNSLCFFFIWLKMTLKCVVHMKTRRFYNHKDPPFDMKHQLMSADPLPVIKIDLE